MVGRRVKGEGPLGGIMVIGEYPGRAEALSGRPFSGATGKELDRFFDGSRLPHRSEIFVSNWIREWPGEDVDFTQADFDRDEPALIEEIQRVQPTLIVCLGRNITRWFLGDVDLEDVHAFQWYLPIDSPRRALFADPAQVVVAAGYNPAAGFRSPELSSAVAYDFAQLEAYLSGDLAARVLYDDPYLQPAYTEIISQLTLDRVLSTSNGVIEFASDTEGWPMKPWSVQISNQAGTAGIIRRKDLIKNFAARVNQNPRDYHFTFHAALHDLGMFRVFGIDVRRLRFDDTSIMSYNLQLEPPGLKPLCVRWNGMAMQSFDDVMGDVSTEIAQDWLLSCTGMEELEYAERCQAEFDRLTTTPYVDAKGKLKPGRKLRVLPKLPKTDLHKALERSLRSKTPRKLWDNQVIDHHVAAKPKYGTMWEATLDHIDPEKALFYAGRDADGTGRLKPKLWERIVANNLQDIYHADLGTVLLIDRMQQIGIKPDLPHFAKLSTDLEVELIEIRARLAEQLVAAGAYDLDSAFAFNCNSTYQVGELLYQHFALPVLKETRDGDPSTNDKILEALEKAPDTPDAARKIISDVRYFRETYKLKYTFCDEIPNYVNRWPFDGRIHASFRITRISTGRLAASDPNLLAMPKYGKFAGRFREGFVSGDGRVLGSWDLSQIELRVLAHLSQDPVLLDAYRRGLDLHAILAQRLFGGTVAQYALKEFGEQRRNAKVINFMIPMGCTAVGLCLELKKNGSDVNEDDAQRWLDETMALYTHVPFFQQEKIAEARRLGYVTDIRGRRFYLGGIRSSHKATRAESERQAGALPIQASAQEVMKVAEAAVWEMIVRRQDAGQWIEPILQIHDDLIPEMDDRIVFDVNRDMIDAMTKVPAHMLSVPIETSGDYGRCWGEMHDIIKHKGDPSFNHVDGCDACEKIKKARLKGKAA